MPKLDRLVSNSYPLKQGDGSDVPLHRWMEGFLWPKVKESWRVCDIIFPGSHNSGSACYSGVGAQWGACQKQSVYQQLCLGIRFLDVRVADDVEKNGTLWVSHRFKSCPLEVVLQDLKRFMDENPQEIVGLRIEKDYDRKLSQHGVNVLDATLSQRFGTSIIDAAGAKDFTINELLSQNRRLLLCPRSIDLKKTVRDPCKLFPSWMSTRTDNPNQVLPHAVTYMTGRHDSIPHNGSNFTMLEVIVTPSAGLIWRNAFSSLQSVSRKVHHDLLSNDYILDIANCCVNKRPCNVIACDFVNDSIVKRIILLNLAIHQSQAMCQAATSFETAIESPTPSMPAMLSRSNMLTTDSFRS
eukprot:Blabericola_migrator_1__9533@NODE_518_length_7920_cov_188_180568_g396_i0_p4_GENE_NODE_518_length_7920_cov_188_180568_g396_i0NODE_518_length_7920_cov_188_180568_g396_i0_p4_ORF_typecomplete_len354_score46_77PIPLCX/PF00388_19/1e10Varsurf_PPLC/PF03490_13/0_0043Varsurf_PPLC/PF03490_13/2_5e03_NODE_518_length_7920_cov_188_180568_g396_i01901251